MPHTPGNFQVRIREADWNKIEQALQEYLYHAKYMAFYHEPNSDNKHHHIYIFGLYRKADAIRERLRKAGYPKENYAVSTRAGKAQVEITPDMAYQYALNPKSNPRVVKMQGFTEEEEKQFAEQARKFYDTPIVANIGDQPLVEVIYKIDRVWERLRTNKEDYKDLTVQGIKAKIAASWLNDGKAMPRPSDLHRYALSLFYINRYEDGAIPDEAMMKEFA